MAKYGVESLTNGSCSLFILVCQTGQPTISCFFVCLRQFESRALMLAAKSIYHINRTSCEFSKLCKLRSCCGTAGKLSGHAAGVNSAVVQYRSIYNSAFVFLHTYIFTLLSNREEKRIMECFLILINYSFP